LSNEKYAISDSKGVELFLRPDTQPLPEKEVNVEEQPRPGNLRIKIALTVIAAVCLIAAVVYVKNSIYETRESSRKFTKINEQFTKLTAEMNLGSGSSLNSTGKRALADSLILSLNSYLYEHPGKTARYGSIWPIVIAYRYLLGWHDNSFLNPSNQLSINRLDIVLEQKITLLDPDLTDIFELLYDLQEFNHYKSLYPLPPESSDKPMPEALVQHLLEKGEKIRTTFAKRTVRLDVNFRTVANMARIVLNSYYPEVKQWADFWQGYNRITGIEDTAKSAKLTADLKQRFPNLKTLEDNDGTRMSAVRNLNWGIVPEGLISFTNDARNQIGELVKYVEKKTGKTIALKTYGSYALLYRDFLLNNLDFCLIGHEEVFRFAQLKGAAPIVQRLHKQSPLLSYYLYGLRGEIKSGRGLNLEALKDKRLFIDGTLFSDLFFEAMEFFSEQAINPARLFSGIDVISETDPVHNGSIPGGYDLLIMTDVKFDKKIKNTPQTRAGVSPFLIKQALSDVVFANTRTVDTSVIDEICRAIMNPSGNETLRFEDFRSWGTFNRDLFNKFAGTERLDQPALINQIVIGSTSLNDKAHEPIVDEFLRALVSYGYSVISERNYQLFSQSVLNLPSVKRIDIRITPQKNGPLNFSIDLTSKGIVPFSYTAAISSRSEENNFNRIIEEMSMRTGFYGEVVEISNDLVQMFSPLNRLLTDDSRFELFKNKVSYDTLQDKFSIDRYRIAAGRFNGLSGKSAILKIEQVGDGKIQPGDLICIQP